MSALYCPLCGRKMRLVEVRGGQPYEEVWECPKHGRMLWRETPYYWELTNLEEE